MRKLERPEIVVFVSGSKDGGGSGLAELVNNIKTGVLNARIISVVSNHANCGVAKIARVEKIDFAHFHGPFEEQLYLGIVKFASSGYVDPFVILSGWLKPVVGLIPEFTVNTHPGPLPNPGQPLKFGGKGMYGQHVHEACLKAFLAKEIDCSAVSMHFVTPNYDEGPVFFRYPVRIKNDDTPQTLGARVNKIEHGWQSWATNLVVTGQIRLLDGKVIVPEWYKLMEFCPAYLR